MENSTSETDNPRKTNEQSDAPDSKPTEFQGNLKIVQFFLIWLKLYIEGPRRWHSFSARFSSLPCPVSAVRQLYLVLVLSKKKKKKKEKRKKNGVNARLLAVNQVNFMYT